MQPTASGAAAVFDGLARLILIGCVAVLPVFVIPFSWAGLAQSKMLLLVLVLTSALLLWMVARLFEGVMRIPRGLLFLAVFLLPVAYLASAAAAGFPTSGILGVGVEQDTMAAVLLWFATFALFVFLFGNNMVSVRASIRALALGLLTLFAFQILYVFLPETFSLGGFLEGQTANLVGSWHDLGILAGLALLCAVSFARSSVFTGFWRIVAIALGATAVFVLVLVHFADVLWGVAALMGAQWLIAIRADLQAGGRSLVDAAMRSIAPLVFAILFVCAAFFSATLWGKLPAQISITEVEVRPSWQGTFDVGRQSLGAPSQVVFGSGPNSFIREWGEHKPEGVNTTPFWNADFTYGVGIIPTSVFTAGLVGLIAWGAIVCVLLGLCYQLVRNAQPLASNRAYFGFLLMGSLYLLVFHMLYTPGVTITALTFILMGLLGVIAAGDRPRWTLEPRTILSSVTFAVAILLAVPIVAAAGLVGREIVSNLYVNQAVTLYHASGDVAGAGGLLTQALSLSPRNDRGHRAAAELGLVEFGQLAAQGEPQTDEAVLALQRTLQRTIQHGLTAVEINDDNYQNWLLLAQVYGSFAGVNIEGAYEQAQATYERAFQANPTNPLPKLRLAQLASARSDLAAARGYVSEALALKPDFAAAHFLLSQIAAVEGNGDEAAQSAAAAVQAVPTDPIGWFNFGYILYLGGAYADAAGALEQAVARANEYSNALFYLGASYYKLGRIEEAILALERVAALNPSETWVRDAVAQLRAGSDPFNNSVETSAE